MFTRITWNEKFQRVLGYFTLLVVIGVLFAPVAFAQENPPIPDSAVGALNELSILLAMALGVLVSWLWDYLKPKVQWMNPEGQDQLNRLLIRGSLALSGILAGLVVDYGIEYALDLDSTGLWASIRSLILVIGPPLFSEVQYRLQKAGKPFVAIAQAQKPVKTIVNTRYGGLEKYLPKNIAGQLEEAGYPTVESILTASDEELGKIGDFTPAVVRKIREVLK